jgi:hypothetical protein
MSTRPGPRLKAATRTAGPGRVGYLLVGAWIGLVFLLGLLLSFFLNILLLNHLIGPSSDVFEFVGFRITRFFTASPT